MQEMDDNIQVLEMWATESNLLLNEKKATQILVSTRQMSKAHSLGDLTPSLTIRDQIHEKVENVKLLGTWLSEDVKWTYHIN